MKKLKYKVGDMVIGIKNDPDYSYIKIIGKIGRIIEIDESKSYSYKVEFTEQVDFDVPKDQDWAYWDEFKEDQIKPINKIKLKALLTN